MWYPNEERATLLCRSRGDLDLHVGAVGERGALVHNYTCLRREGAGIEEMHPYMDPTSWIGAGRIDIFGQRGVETCASGKARV